ncbi:MAG: transposase [Nitrosopumilus sp.]|nr:transposase [Nitrosopumilus sp.]
MAEIFDRFVEKTPVGVMTRALLERALVAQELDELFAEHAEQQYERKLLFSTMVDLMALVVCGVHPSVNAAYKAIRERIPSSLTAVYDKLGGVEMSTTEALVAHSAQKLRPVVSALGAIEPWLPGHRIRLLDGNHLAATERRLEVLRASAAGPLPGQSLVVLEPESGLVVQMVGCEDGYAQERSLLDPILSGACPKDVYLADRNFCTLGLMFGLEQRGASFIIRQHANLPIESLGRLRRRGKTETGTVLEQPVRLRLGESTLTLRRIVLRLSTPTRDGDTEMAILTDLPPSISAETVARSYRKRWDIETLFARVERDLNSEISALGYPKAALFGFGVALVAANIFAVVRAALEAAKRSDETAADMPLSEYAIAHAARSSYEGIDAMLDDDFWEQFRTMPPRAFAKKLVAWAKWADWPRFRKSVRGPKKPVPKRTRFKNRPHVSTARLLAE